ncbi:MULTISPECIES: acyl carrier protein [Dyella]|uniref:acyl carrier protein n=1 Tax=Dyella TaxID=231454 RepID=UPI0013F146D7|nr:MULTISPECIES: acyl carrier protein [Dyella]
MSDLAWAGRHPDDIRRCVRAIVARVAGRESDELSPAARLQEDLNVDSLEFLYALQEIEGHLPVTIDVDGAARSVTLGDLEDLVVRRLLDE